MIDSERKSQATASPTLPVYRRPSRRGGNGGKRELTVTALQPVRGKHPRRRHVVPYIRMSGAWLQRLGFRRGDRIEVTAERERVVLTVRREELKPVVVSDSVTVKDRKVTKRCVFARARGHGQATRATFWQNERIRIGDRS